MAVGGADVSAATTDATDATDATLGEISAPGAAPHGRALHEPIGRIPAPSRPI
jgi:hypothetical protein